MTRPSDEQEPQQTLQCVRPYHAPQLSVYGAMKALTAGGSAAASENAQGVGQGQGLRKP
jgi:hypothetical protein